MADPVLPGFYRAQCILPGISGLPEDRFVTTWCFELGTGSDTSDIADSLVAFWNTPVSPSSEGAAQWIGPQVDRDSCEIRVYDLADAPGAREPEIFPFTLDATSGSGQGLPAEVAVTLSFYATVNAPRRRGRVYIGPLDSHAVALSEGDVRPTFSVQTSLRRQAQGLASNTAVSWSLLSQTDGAAFPVTAGWIDNACDTQRRRGVDPTNRVLWPGVE